MAQRSRGRFTATAELPGYPTRCLGYDRDGLAVPCESPSFAVQLCGRCVRCHQLHRRDALRRVDPWASASDVAMPGDERRGALEDLAALMGSTRSGGR